MTYLTGDKSLQAEIGVKRLGAVAIIYKPSETARLFSASTTSPPQRSQSI